MNLSREFFQQSFRARLLATIFAGALVGFSLPPWGWWPLAIFGSAIFFSLCNLSQSSREQFVLGACFAISWLGIGMLWMWWLTAPGYIVVVLLFSTLHGVAATIAQKFGNTPFSRPLTHCLAETLRFSLPFGGVPLATLPIAVSPTKIADVVSLGGPILTTWFVLQFAAMCAAYFNRRETRSRVLKIAVSLLTIQILAIAISPVKNTGESLRIALVQGGGPQGVLAINSSARDSVDRHLKVTQSLQPNDALDAVLWPENVIDVVEFKTSNEYAEILSEAKRLDTEFVVGITEDAGPNRFTNAQVVVQPNGEISSRYDKVRRVPFGEYAPAGLRNLLSEIGAPMNRIPSDAVAGISPGILKIRNHEVAVVISWESFFSGRANSGVEAGGQMLLNPTNGSSYTGSVLQTQQVATNTLRSRETGRWILQAATTGFSAIITPDGKITNRLGIGVAQTLIFDVPLRAGRTIYSQLGDAIFIILLLVSLYICRFKRHAVQVSR